MADIYSPDMMYIIKPDDDFNDRWEREQYSETCELCGEVFHQEHMKNTRIGWVCNDCILYNETSDEKIEL